MLIMAKKIKFNLCCDGNPIRTIEDLQNNFLIEDILSYYENNLLEKWLDVRGYTEQLEQIRKITSKDDFEIAKQLVTIFNIEKDPKKVEEELYILEYNKKQKESADCYEWIEEAQADAVNDYITDYNDHRSKLLDSNNRFNIPLLKSSIHIITEHYLYLFAKEYRDIFWYLYENGAYIPIFCLLMNQKTRSLLFSTINDANSYKSKNNIPQFVKDFRLIDTKLRDLINNIETTKERCGDCLQVFEIKSTGGNWKTSEEFSRDKEYMIIRAPEQGALSRIVNTNETAEPYNYMSDEKFKILKGIQYQFHDSKTYESEKFYYMEV